MHSECMLNCMSSQSPEENVLNTTGKHVKASESPLAKIEKYDLKRLNGTLTKAALSTQSLGCAPSDVDSHWQRCRLIKTICYLPHQSTAKRKSSKLGIAIALKDTNVRVGVRENPRVM